IRATVRNHAVRNRILKHEMSEWHRLRRRTIPVAILKTPCVEMLTPAFIRTSIKDLDSVAGRRSKVEILLRRNRVNIERVSKLHFHVLCGGCRSQHLSGYIRE